MVGAAGGEEMHRLLPVAVLVVALVSVVSAPATATATIAPK